MNGRTHSKKLAQKPLLALFGTFIQEKWRICGTSRVLLGVETARGCRAGELILNPTYKPFNTPALPFVSNVSTVAKVEPIIGLSISRPAIGELLGGMKAQTTNEFMEAI
jgi:hypothetical protein